MTVFLVVVSCSTTTLNPIEYTTASEQTTDSTEQMPFNDIETKQNELDDDITQSDSLSQDNFPLPLRSGTRQQRIHVFRPLFVYRQEQIKKNRVKPKPKPTKTKTTTTTTTPAPTYNPDRYGSAYPFYGSYYPSYSNYPSSWSNYYSSYYYPYYYHYGYPSSSSSNAAPSGFYLPPTIGQPIHLPKPSNNLEAPYHPPNYHLPPYPAPIPVSYHPSYSNYQVSYWRK